MIRARPSPAVFHEGDQVTLAEDIYQCTLGVFLRLRDNTNWADIREWDGSVRSHPTAWLAHAADTTWGSKLL